MQRIFLIHINCADIAFSAEIGDSYCTKFSDHFGVALTSSTFYNDNNDVVLPVLVLTLGVFDSYLC